MAWSSLSCCPLGIFNLYTKDGTFNQPLERLADPYHKDAHFIHWIWENTQSISINQNLNRHHLFLLKIIIPLFFHHLSLSKNHNLLHIHLNINYIHLILFHYEYQIIFNILHNYSFVIIFLNTIYNSLYLFIQLTEQNSYSPSII